LEELRTCKEVSELMSGIRSKLPHKFEGSIAHAMDNVCDMESTIRIMKRVLGMPTQQDVQVNTGDIRRMFTTHFGFVLSVGEANRLRIVLMLKEEEEVLRHMDLVDFRLIKQDVRDDRPAVMRAILERQATVDTIVPRKFDSSLPDSFEPFEAQFIPLKVATFNADGELRPARVGVKYGEGFYDYQQSCLVGRPGDSILLLTEQEVMEEAPFKVLCDYDLPLWVFAYASNSAILPWQDKDGWECGDLECPFWRVDMCTLDVRELPETLELAGWSDLEASRYVSHRMLHPNTRIVGGVHMYGSMDCAF
jgi:hypothetical protein